MARRILVVGGSGFIGSHVVRTALAQGGLHVASVSRTGQPPQATVAGLEGAEWLRGDISKADDVKRVLEGVDSVVSCLGGFGTNEAMRALNGEANAALAEAAAASGVRRFAYVSAAPSRILESFGPIGYGALPVWWPFGPGYFEGKRIAEEAVAAHFGAAGLALRPGFVYGPLSEAARLWKAPAQVGYPLETLFSAAPVRSLASALGPLGDLLAPPASVQDVAGAAVAHLMADAVATGSGDGGDSSSGGDLVVVEGPSLVELARRLQ